MSPGCLGCQPSSDRVRSLEVGASMAANIANQPKCSAASSGDFETTGMFRRRPITSAIALNGTPSSAVAWNVRAGQAEHVMAGADQVLDDGRADPTGRSSDKYAHRKTSGFSLETIVCPQVILVK